MCQSYQSHLYIRCVIIKVKLRNVGQSGGHEHAILEEDMRLLTRLTPKTRPTYPTPAFCYILSLLNNNPDSLTNHKDMRIFWNCETTTCLQHFTGP